MRLRLTRTAVLAALVVPCVGALVAAPAAHAAPRADLPTRAPAAATGPSFGPILDWTADTALAYARRLGGTPGFYGQSIGYPLTSADRDQIDVAAHAAAAQGADVLLQLEPRTPLASLTAGQAADLASSLDTLASGIKTRFAVDFAPEMNGSWVNWGQQPRAYVAAFQRIAAAVHARNSDRLSTVWEPASGGGYPYGGARGEVKPSGPRVVGQLDTNGDGTVTEKDDAYQPYWPGSTAVDRVALSAYWYGTPGDLGTDVAPRPAGSPAR